MRRNSQTGQASVGGWNLSFPLPVSTDPVGLRGSGIAHFFGLENSWQEMSGLSGARSLTCARGIHGFWGEPASAHVTPLALRSGIAAPSKNISKRKGASHMNVTRRMFRVIGLILGFVLASESFAQNPI